MTTKSQVPLPPSEAGLPVIMAEPWLKIDDDPGIFIEGPSFDREGNLYLTSIMHANIYKVTPDLKISIIFSTKKGVLLDGTAIHKDGRLFVVSMSGEFISMNTDGSNVTYIEARYKGQPKSFNDITFDSKGYCYVTDFTGNYGNPTGGVYRYTPDFKKVEPVIEGLAAANGLAFAPEGNVLWVAETSRNQLDNIQLLEDGITIAPIAGATSPYRHSGGPGGCDSMAIDVDGNVYQCMIFQGRVLILNSRGVPLAHVLIPGRDEGKNLGTANMAFKPCTDEGYLTGFGEGGAWMFKFRGLAKGLKLYSHY